MALEQTLFYGFSGILILSALVVVLSRNTVRSALSLVLAFIMSAIIWLILQAEFLALVLVLVYVGAVMTLFLFVVMMLNLDVEPLKRRVYVKYLPIGAVIIAIFVAILLIISGPQNFGLSHFIPPSQAAADYSNTEALGRILYTVYVYPFELSAVILLVAIVAAITLAFRGRQKRKDQDPGKQVDAKRADRVRLVKMASESRQDKP